MAESQSSRPAAVSPRFHAEFCIHDTVLTRALELGDFKTSLAILKDNSADRAFVNDGPYERFPLYIVLCGHNSEGEKLPRNLQFAQMLLNNGADPNKRVPTYDPLLGIRSSMSPIEVLVRFFYSCQRLFAFNRWEDNDDEVIGLDGKIKMAFSDVRQHLLQLLTSFIGSGAKLCFSPDESGVSMLNYMLWTYPDAELVKRLVQAGVDVNHTDIHHQNAIFALCFSFPIHIRRRELNFLQREVLNYLLKETDIQVEAANCQNQSALWVAMSVKRYDLAEILLSVGANEEVFGCSYIATDPVSCDQEIYVAENVPPILAPFIPSPSDALKKACIHKDSKNVQHFKTSSQISYFVDKGYFNKKSIEDSVMKFLSWHPYFKWHQDLLECMKGNGRIVPDLFGCLSTTLKQLCIRKIFQNHFMIEQNCAISTTNESVHMSNKWTALFELNHSGLSSFLQRIALPLSFLSAMELELFHQKMLITLQHSIHSWVPCSCLVDRQDQNSDSDVTSDEDDAELENGAVVAFVSNPLADSE